MPDADLYGFTQATILLAEGARVAVVSCETCGASLLLDPRETISVIDRHRAWHGSPPSRETDAPKETNR